MTQQEFMVRTGCNPSTTDEFWAIHNEYVNSPFSKDEFCKNWAHQNAHKFKSPVMKNCATEEETAKAVAMFTAKNANFRVVGRKTIYWYD